MATRPSCSAKPSATCPARRRFAGLVIDHGERAVGQPVDPVGAAMDAHPAHPHFAVDLGLQHAAPFGAPAQ
jgi:hypothetical protein